MTKKVVISVDIIADKSKAGAMSITADKSKNRVMSIAARFPGVESVASDWHKGMLTVVGDMDVGGLVQALRKAKYQASVISIDNAKEKKVNVKEKFDEPHNWYPPYPGPPPAVVYCCEDDPDSGCIIM